LYVEEIAMSKPSRNKRSLGASPSSQTAVDRRRFFMMGGSAVAAAAVVLPLASEQAEADETQAERLKARYKETDHVKNYYRVNRY
jgi:hypothetical protein